MISLERRQSSSRRGNLLELASFLTKIQSHLIPEGMGSNNVDTTSKSSGLVVSPKDIENVYEYRRLLQDREKLLNDIITAEEFGLRRPCFLPSSRTLSDQLKDKVDDLDKLLEDCIARTRQVHFLLTRLEVWWTKLVSQEYLMVPTAKLRGISSKTSYCCLSPFLNIPGSSCYAQSLPRTKNRGPQWKSKSGFHEHKIDCCSLPVPPNKHTWQEFARILKMVILLDNDAYRENNAFKIRCCIHDALPSRKSSLRKTHRREFEFGPADMVALWVRAQRNTQSMRHLWMLFELIPEVGNSTSVEPVALSVQGTGSKGGGKQLVANTEDNTGQNRKRSSSYTKNRSFKAHPMGNPSHASMRIVEMSSLVDQLVEFVVINQVLFTHQRIQDFLLIAPIRKRKRIASLRLVHQRVAKKAKLDDTLGDKRFELQAACQSFVLRWFARRNRAATSFLFSKHTESLPLDLGYSIEDQSSFDSCVQQIELRIKDYLSQSNGAECTPFKEDRTFSRLDRRLNVANRYQCPKINFNMKNQVLVLLEGLEMARQWDASDTKKRDVARRDIAELYDHFFNPSKDIVHAAHELIDANIDSTELAKLLSGAPKPWPDVPKPWPDDCVTGETDDTDSQVFTCANCERACHTKRCAPDHVVVSLKDVIRTFKPLGYLCRLRQPIDAQIPDYADRRNLTWTEHKIVIERRQLADGKVTPLGLGIRDTEDCEKLLRKLQDERACVPDLVETLKQKRAIYPMNVQHKGCVVIDVKDGDFCGKEAGIIVGDIIHTVEHVEVLDPEELSEFKGMPSLELSYLPLGRRLKALRIRSTKLRLKIFRPSIKIVGESKQWWKEMKSLNKVLCGALHNDRFNLWYCGECIQANDNHYISSHENNISREARLCRAVLRRVGLEEYAVPFIDERNDQDSRENHSQLLSDVTDVTFFSLRRLDAMMTSIIEKNTSIETGSACANAFLLPTWACLERRNRRLHWASKDLEGKPAYLLCNAISALEDAVSTNNEYLGISKANTQEFLRHFVLAFTSWCVLPSLEEETPLGNMSPPLLFQQMRQPWLSASCSICYARPCAEAAVTCEGTACDRALYGGELDTQDIQKEEALETARRAMSYSECSSFVGTTFLVQYEDPLVSAVERLVRVPIPHFARPIEFVVASYLPPEYSSQVLKARPRDQLVDKFDEGDGIFHLLPVISSVQLKYLLQRCNLRTNRKHEGSNDNLSWVNVDVFNFEGVARYSLSALQQKLNESQSIRQSMDCTIAAMNGATNVEEHFGHSESELRSISHVCFDAVDNQVQLINALLSGDHLPPSVQRMLSDGTGESSNDLVDPFFCQSNAIQKTKPAINTITSEVNLLSPCASDKHCILVYSDLHYSSEDDKRALLESLNLGIIESPPQDLDSSQRQLLRKTILVERDTISGNKQYDGLGFGFELVRWPWENKVRVGRIHKHSPAYRSGLRSNDTVLEVGGREISQIINPSAVIDAILGASFHFRCQSHLVLESLCSILSTMRRTKVVLHSIVLTIGREQFSTHELQSPHSNPSTAMRSANSKISPPQLYNGLSQPADSSTMATHSLSEAAKLSKKSTISSSKIGVSSDISSVKEHRIAAVIDQKTIFQDDHPRGTHQPTTINVALDKKVGSVGHSVSEVEYQGTMQAPSNTRLEYDQSLPSDSRPNSTSVQPRERHSLRLLHTVVLQTQDQRTVANFGHLYWPAGHGIVFTLMEASIFLEALSNGQPKLGCRLLLPRYDMDTISRQLKVMATWSSEQVRLIPRVSDKLYKEILFFDYRRLTNELKPEVGPPIFSEQTFFYKMPVDILPIDRSIERVLQKTYEQNESQHQIFYQRFQNQTPSSAMGLDRTQASRAQDFFEGQISQAQHCSSRQQYIENRQWHRGTYVGDHVDGENLNLPSTLPQYDVGLSRSSGQNEIDLTGETHLQQDFVSPERIRGGGTSFPGENVQDNQVPEAEERNGSISGLSGGEARQTDVCITQLPIDQWKGKAVHALVSTAEGEESSAKLVGWIKKVDISEGQEPETVEVEARYLSSIGYFAVPKSFSLYSADLSIVDETTESEEATVVQKLRSKGHCPTVVHKISDPKPLSIPKRWASDFASRTGDQMKILGEIPDGREIVWVPYDPAALYLSELLPQQAISNFDSPRLSMIASGHTCPWGCSIALATNGESHKGRQALHFEAEHELHKHLVEYHSYCNDSDPVDLSSKRHFFRVSEGNGICKLHYDISAAIVAQIPDILHLTHQESTSKMRLQSGLSFFKSPIDGKLSLPLTVETRRAVLDAVLKKKNKRSLSSLCGVWSRLARLFDSDGSGLFRLSQAEFETAVLQDTCGSACESSGCSCQLSAAAGEGACNDKRFLACSLCSLPWENVLEWEGEIGNLSTTESHFRGGIGCQLLTDETMEYPSSANVKKFAGQIGEAKELLLRIAEKVSPTVKAQGPQGSIDPLRDNRIWDENNYDVWQSFVYNCTNPRMLTQALTTLLASIRRAGMPSWWRQEGGNWSTAQMLMANATLPTFFLHLYVLDAAIADATYNCSKTDKRQKQTSFGFSLDKIKECLVGAEELGVSRFSGAHDDDCLVCGEGGSLLCCEFCSNVQHADCYNPPILEDTDSFDWVCNACANDIFRRLGH